MKRAAALVFVLMLLLAVVYGVGLTRRDAAYRDLIARGDAALARDDTFGAIEAFTQAQDLRGDLMAAYLKRGEAFRRRHEFDAALRDLKRATELDPLAPLPHEVLGDIHYGLALERREFSSARFAQALEQYGESARLDDANARVQYKLGVASYHAGQLENALAALRRAIDLDSRLVEAHYMLGVTLRASQQPADAIRALKRAVELNRLFLAAQEELADLYARLGRFDEGLEHLEALRTLDPSPARERQLGLGYARAGHVDRAVAQLGYTARRYPEDAETYIALGRFWLSRAASGGHVEASKALEALERGVGKESSSDALTLLGRAQLLVGQVAKAEATLLQASARMPVAPQAFLYLSEASARRGREEQSDRALLDYAALVRFDTLDVRTLLRIADANLRAGQLSEARRAATAVLERDASNSGALQLLARTAR